MNKSISLLLLVHNEIDTIENEIVQINKFLSNNSNSELVIVQDGSSDGTYEKLNELSEQIENMINKQNNPFLQKYGKYIGIINCIFFKYIIFQGA